MIVHVAQQIELPIQGGNVLVMFAAGRTAGAAAEADTWRLTDQFLSRITPGEMLEELEWHANMADHASAEDEYQVEAVL